MMRLFICAVVWVAIGNGVAADDPTNKIREGMRLYSAEQFEEASKSFAAATESFEKARSDKAAISAFDEACALHRNGALDLARERYLKAGLSQDKGIATSAHFNMGVIASEQARKLAGETPETVPADKRKEILNELSRSIDSYRHCLELQPQHGPARRNLELLRQWIKYHTDRWREADLQKRRDETNLIQFLEYLVQAQLSIKQSAESFRSNTSPNAFAELKRVQEELHAEIPYLKDKIESELRPKKEVSSSTTSKAGSPQSNEDLERGIALLNGWAEQAGEKMAAAGRDLMKRDAIAAADKQQRAADQLDLIWDAIVPFHPLLAKELAEQTQIAKQLTPIATTETIKEEAAFTEKPTEKEGQEQKLEVQTADWSQLLEQQERVLRKTRLLSPKAESELAQVESRSKASETENEAPPVGVNDAGAAASKVDPEAIKAGYQKALELAPKAVEELESAAKHLGKRERGQAATHTEEARRILKEIQDAQPKQPDQDQSDQNKDQDKNQPQDNDQQKDKDEEQKKKEEEDKNSKDEEKKSEEQKQDKQQEEKKKAGEDQKDKEKQAEKRQEPKVSQDRIENALRRVREREQEKRERDRELRARVLGRVPVDKDW